MDAGRVEEPAHFVVEVQQQLLVRDTLRNLQAEGEPIWRAVAPALDHLACGTAVERAIDFHVRVVLGDVG
jgi:hypothetical protein